MEFQEFLSWLVYGGGSIMAVSWILERSKKFQELNSEAKEWLVFGLVTALSIGTYAFQTYVSPEFIQQITPFANIVIATFMTLFLGKAFHLVDKQ